jgi:chemotaxis protein CheY-P-specific phosphatase CheC
MSTTPDKPEIALAALLGLAASGADWAASALEQVVGRSVASRSPVFREAPGSSETGPWRTALFFETEAALPGLVALLLTPASRDLLLRTLLGGHTAPDPRTRRSALCELGNIVASQTVSAMANELGATVLLSVPELSDGDVESDLAAALAARRGGAGCARIESALCDSRGEVRALLVIAPDALEEIGA